MASPTRPLTRDLMNAVFAMHIVGGHICLPFTVLCTILSRNFSRNPLFLHFCFSWIIYSVAFSILLYIGKFAGPEPASVPCSIQSILIYIAPVLGSSFLCALVYHLFFTINSVKTEVSKTRMMILITGPYLISLVPALSATVVAMKRPELVYRGNHYYCAVYLSLPRIIASCITGIFLVIAVVLQCRIGFILYRRRLALKQVTVQGFDQRQLFVRLSFFLVLTAGSGVMAIAAIADGNNEVRVVYQSTLPLLAFLTFGTRRSLYQFHKEEPGEIKQPHAKRRLELQKSLHSAQWYVADCLPCKSLSG